MTSDIHQKVTGFPEVVTQPALLDLLQIGWVDRRYGHDGRHRRLARDVEHRIRQPIRLPRTTRHPNDGISAVRNVMLVEHWFDSHPANATRRS